MLPSLLPFCSLDILGRHILNQNSLIYEYAFSPSARVSPVFLITSVNFLGFLVILRPCSTIPDHVPCLPSLGAGPQHDVTASLGRRLLPLWLLVTRWYRPLLMFSDPPLLSLHKFPDSLSPLPSSLSRPRSCSGSRSHPCPRAHFRPRPRSRHRFLPLVPGALFSPRFHMVVEAPGLAPKAAGYLQAPYPVYREDAACGMVVPGLVLCFIPDMADTKTLLLPPFLFHFRPRLLLPSFPSPFSSCVRSLVSISVPVPASDATKGTYYLYTSCLSVYVFIRWNITA